MLEFYPFMNAHLTFMQDTLISVNQLGIIRQDRVLFNELSFNVNAGDIIHIAGPNGIGKSTLLSILTGLLSPSFGEVVGPKTNPHLFLGHKNALGAHTVLDQIYIFALQRGVETSLVKECVYRWLVQVGLDTIPDIAKWPIELLSQGQKRRLAFIRLIMGAEQDNAPKLWILDEPFAAIDALGVAVIERLIKDHIHQGGAVILTSHQACYSNKLIELSEYVDETTREALCLSC